MEDRKTQAFEDLRVWQEAMELAVEVYKISRNFPDSEQFAITNQIRRSSTSVSANIAEGFGRQSQKEKLQFFSIAYGSLLETKSFLYLSERLEYINKEDLNSLLEKITILQKQMNSLTKVIRTNV
jgi:four helix bundle protein